MTAKTCTVYRADGESLGPVVYNRAIKHIIRESTNSSEYFTIYTRLSVEPQRVMYHDRIYALKSLRLCDEFRIQRVYNDGTIQELGRHMLPVSSEGKIEA